MDREVFLRIAKSFQAVNGFAGYAVPLSIGPTAAVELLHEFILRDNESTFVRIDRALPRTPWLYTAGDCHMDVTYERFASQDQDLLRSFVSEAAPRQLELISIF